MGQEASASGRSTCVTNISSSGYQKYCKSERKKSFASFIISMHSSCWKMADDCTACVDNGVSKR